jgi:general secretion pathway protein G
MKRVAQVLRITGIHRTYMPVPACCTRHASGTGLWWNDSVDSGFTLIELMMVIAMIGILSGIGAMNYVGYMERARVVKAVAEIEILEKEIVAYQLEIDSWPNTLADIDRQNFLDPWGTPYQYLNFDTIAGGGVGMKRKDRWNNPLNNDFDLYSMGPDGLSVSALTAAQSRDDIVRANDGQYIGPASDY